MTKASPGKRKIVATQPYEVLSIDFSFAGIVSKDKSRREDIEGLNGETCWIVAQDVFSKIIHADVRISKAAPAQWLDKLMETYKPVGVPKRFICVDQGREIYGSDAINCCTTI